MAEEAAGNGALTRLRLEPEALRRRCDPEALGFATTDEVEPLEGLIGQPRALAALEFGLGIETPGYHVFATGPVGTGKRTMVESLLRERAAGGPPPPDWIYLLDFDAEERPIALALPAGRGSELAEAMAGLVAETRRRIPRAFESEDYGRRRRELGEELEGRRDEVLAELRDFARERGLAIELTPAGLMTVPMTGGRALTADELKALPEAAKQRYKAAGEEIEEQMPTVMNRLRTLEREAAERLRDLDREVGLFAVGHLLDEIVERFAGIERLTKWLERVREDVLDNLSRFREGESGGELPAPMAAEMRRAQERFFARYEPNVLVGGADGDGAPVVFETSPTYYNLFGRVEYEASFGSLTTSHLLVKPGAVHRANGGYLIVQALDLLAQPFVWTKLKDTLRSRRIQIENIGAQLMLFPTSTLEPEPIELDLKVILVGPAHLHALLHALDEDLRKLFKVRADFDVEIGRDESSAAQYAAFIARQAQEDELPPFDAGAVARVVEEGSRAIDHSERLSVRFMDVADLVAEAAHWARTAGSSTVAAEHVERAVDERRYRSDLVEEKIRALIAEGSLLVDTTGERIGQVNGLSVASTGDFAFGRPVRVTAAVGAGEGGVVNIDRETELSGPVHDKGFLILQGILAERFGGEHPLSLRASLVFEQSYAEIEGDSASVAELAALLSAIAQVPVRQAIAVTGSVNQRGAVQAIGAVNEKVEGFFAVCREAGLDGSQGVLIPAANVRHLMLRPEVVEAVREGSFNLWAASTVDEALELLTGLPAGERDEQDRFPAGTLGARVDERLADLAEIGKRYRTPAGDDSP